MWICAKPTTSDSIDVLKTALTYKDGTFKYALSNQYIINMQVIYGRYETLQGKADPFLTGENALNSDALTAIHDGYGEVQGNNRLSDFRDRLLLAAEICPCCGILPADTLDHHLPRSIYKALAVYASNLVPMCHKCNNKKRTVAGLTPSDSFMHIYFDEVPEDERFLIANTVMIEGKLKVSFNIENTQNLDDDIYEMAKFQLERVGFNGRIIAAITQFLAPLYTSINAVFLPNEDPEHVSQYLLAIESDMIGSYGVNDWRTSLLYSLSENNDFCNGGYKSALGRA